MLCGSLTEKISPAAPPGSPGRAHQLIATWKRGVFHPVPFCLQQTAALLFKCFVTVTSCICNPPALLYLSNPLCCICNPCSIVFEAFLRWRPIVSHDGPDCQTSNLARPRLVTDKPLVYVTIDYLLRSKDETAPP